MTNETPEPPPDVGEALGDLVAASRKKRKGSVSFSSGYLVLAEKRAEVIYLRHPFNPLSRAPIAVSPVVEDPL
jgi:hypothetical protein